MFEHGGYVSDAVKIDAYRRALGNLIRPDDVVIDMGCGSGLLGLLALEAGAARLIAVDSGPILELARETFERNGFGDRVEYHRMHSSELTLATPADVLVYDQVGGFAHEVGLTRNVRDLLDRGVLKAGRTDRPRLVRPLRGTGVGTSGRRPRPALDHRRERIRLRAVPSIGGELAVPVDGDRRLAARARRARGAPRRRRRGHHLVRGRHAGRDGRRT